MNFVNEVSKWFWVWISLLILFTVFALAGIHTFVVGFVTGFSIVAAMSHAIVWKHDSKVKDLENRLFSATFKHPMSPE